MMTARGDELADLCASAARVRAMWLSCRPARPSGRLAISYSGATRSPGCRDYYCTFVVPLRAQGSARIWEMTSPRCCPPRCRIPVAREALFTQTVRGVLCQARERERGYDSTLSYVRAMATVCWRSGLLPHLNPGVMMVGDVVLNRWRRRWA